MGKAEPQQGPLSGYLILDLSTWQNGPFAAVMLADMGAEVIKVEEPEAGDAGRNVVFVPGFDRDDFKIYWETMNRNKRGVTLNLKHEQGREAFYRMVRRADVVVENYRVGVAERLGVDYESLKKVNPRIIRAANSGMGPKGPEAPYPLMDAVGQARSGFTHLISEPDGTPANLGVAIADQTGAIILAYAITLALHARERFGVGQNIETSQLGAMMMLLQPGIHQAFIAQNQVRRTSRLTATNPLANSYKCADGKWLAMAGYQGARYWPITLKVLGLEGIEHDARFSSMELRAVNKTELIAIFDAAFKKRPRTEWLRAMQAAGLIVGPVQTFEELWEDPQCQVNGYLAELEHPTRGTIREVGTPIQFSATPPPGPRNVAPEFGQHTEEVLSEFGFTWEEIAELQRLKAI